MYELLKRYKEAGHTLTWPEEKFRRNELMTGAIPGMQIGYPDGTLAQEGNVFVIIAPGPYQLPYGAIIPQKKKCTNLVVPVCMSASHVAYSSIRMESTYMVMGEAAGLAAALAIKRKKAVQDVNRADLTARLQTYGAKLAWDGKGYRTWRYNVFSKNPTKETTRWETNPEEYAAYPISVLWK